MYILYIIIFFFIIFTVLFISYLIAFSVLNMNLNNYYNNAVESTWEKQPSGDALVLYNKLLHIKTYMQEHLCLIFIIPILCNLLFMGIFKSIDISENINQFVILLVIKAIFSIYILIKNALDEEKDEIVSSFDSIKQIVPNDKIPHDLVEHIHDSFEKIYNIVYSIELVVSIVLIIIIYKMHLD